MEEKKVAVVTGASGGIGSACCRALAEEGFRVGIHYRTGKEAAERLSKKLSGSFLLHADLGDPEGIDRMVEEIRKGAGRVDVLVNNAGLSINRDIHTMKMEEFDAQRQMVRGAWYLTKRVLRLFML